MPITQVPQQYQTSDGFKFSTQAEAERHEELITARREYDKARYRLGVCLAQAQKTADGMLFEFGTWRKYYFVTEGYFRMPEVREVAFWLSGGFTFEDRDDEFTILQTEEGRGQMRYRISTLYQHKANAERALLAAQEKWLAERAAEVEETRARVGGGR